MTEPNRTLMQRALDKVALWQLIDQSCGELTETLEAWLTEVDHGLATKVDSYKFYLDELEHEEKRLREQAQEIQKAAQSVARIQSRLKDRIKFVMDSLGVDEVNGDSYRFKLQLGPSRLEINETLLPPSAFIVETIRKPDKERIRTVLESGEQVPGASLERGWVLRNYIAKKG